MRTCEHRTYHRTPDGFTESPACGDAPAGFDVAWTRDQLDQLLDGADTPVPVTVAYCARHLRTPDRDALFAEPGWGTGVYAPTTLRLPVEGPRAP